MSNTSVLWALNEEVEVRDGLHLMTAAWVRPTTLRGGAPQFQRNNLRGDRPKLTRVRVWSNGGRVRIGNCPGRPPTITECAKVVHKGTNRIQGWENKCGMRGCAGERVRATRGHGGPWVWMLFELLHLYGSHRLTSLRLALRDSVLVPC